MKGNTNFYHKSFYNFIKQEINLLVNEKSYDNENRERIPENEVIIDIREEIVQTQRWIREWCDWTYQYKSGIEKIKRLKRELETIKN